jgi:hypothetical protein
MRAGRDVLARQVGDDPGQVVADQPGTEPLHSRRVGGQPLHRLADQGDIEQACAVGAQAVDLTAGLRSARSVQYIRNRQRALRGAADAPAVQEFTAASAIRPSASGRPQEGAGLRAARA